MMRRWQVIILGVVISIISWEWDPVPEADRYLFCGTQHVTDYLEPPERFDGFCWWTDEPSITLIQYAGNWYFNVASHSDESGFSLWRPQ